MNPGQRVLFHECRATVTSSVGEGWWVRTEAGEYAIAAADELFLLEEHGSTDRD